MILYKTKSYYDQKIEQVECEKANEKSVWINGRRNARTSNYENYFETFEKAKEYLKERALARLNHALGEVKRSEESLIKIENLQP